MSKYKVKPIDFTGCHPVIAEHLRRGEAVLCRCWDEDPCDTVDGFVIAFDSSDYPYRTGQENGCDWWQNAEPIETKLYWRKASEIVKWLEDNGYAANSSGDWIGKENNMYSGGLLSNCGTPVGNIGFAQFPGAWFEER